VRSCRLRFKSLVAFAELSAGLFPWPKAFANQKGQLTQDDFQVQGFTALAWRNFTNVLSERPDDTVRIAGALPARLREPM
jgi:hypothetical protein